MRFIVGASHVCTKTALPLVALATAAFAATPGLLGCGGDASTQKSSTTAASTSTSTTTSAGGAGGGGTTSGSGGATGGSGGSGGATSSSSAGGAGGAGGAACVPAPETCNGVDDDCDNVVDNGDPGGGATCDTGLNGICATGVEHCVQGVVSCVPDHGPGEVVETCNGLDDDCDGLIDEGLALQSYYKDDDGDGFGTQATLQACSQPAGYADKSGDCNDNNLNIYPGAIELCNDADDNCNGFVDEGVQKPTFYKDNDGDSFGGVTSILACSAPVGYVADSGDCNDFNANIHPGAPEACNDLDDDCNGLIDDGIPTQTIYKDNDGDSFAAANAQTQAKCNVPIGWALPKDATGDNVPDWDCNDSDVTVYPAAPTICGDGKDNNCDGVVDRLCFTACPGTWPFQPATTAGGVDAVSHADLDGDGHHELVFQSDSAFAILGSQGNVLYQVGGGLNFSRGQALVADIDNYDQFSPSVQSLEVLTGNASKLTYYKDNGGVITPIPSNLAVYDASPLMASDFNHDGVVELLTTSWCVGSQGTRVFRYDRVSNTISNVVDIADPDGTCEYADGRMLSDLDGDGVPELVFGNGYADSQSPSIWKGHVYADSFTNVSTLTTAPYCAAGTCFATDQPSLFNGGIYGGIFRIGDEVRLRDVYFTQNVQGSPSTSLFWSFDSAGQPLAGSPTASNTHWDADTDINDDGTPETSSEVAFLGYFDVNGDGYPDRIFASGTDLGVALWSNATSSFVTNSGSTKTIAAATVSVRTLWDIDGSGRLAVISTDANHNTYCHQLGPKTWTRGASLPPHFPLYLRTYQWDNYEPNEGTDTNNDGMPDEVIRLPSALTTKGDFYGYLSSAKDKDYYLVDAGYSGPICVTAPKGRSYNLHVYSFADKLAPVGPDGMIWEDTSAKQVKCFYPGSFTPTRSAEYRFIIGIDSAGDFSPYWPYWISAPK